MKLKVFALLACFALTATSMQVMQSDEVRREVKKNKLGGMEIIDFHEHGSHKTVMLPSKTYLRDYAQQTDFMKDAAQ